MSSPLVMPPCTPPLQFVFVPIEPSVRFTNGSLCLLPGTSVPRKPEPISKAFVAGIESIACASVASSLSKTGSPSPEGTRRITQVTVPPIESDASFARRMRYGRLIGVDGKNSFYVTHTLTMRSAVSGCGQRVGWLSTCSRVTVCRSSSNSGLSASSTASSSSLLTSEGLSTEFGKCTLPTEETKATISMP